MLTYHSNNATKYGATSDSKLTATIEMSELSDFLKFTVNLDEIPISTDSKIMKDDSVTKLSEITSGKNVVINWEFLDNFNTNGELWFDANGLQMVHKDLW